jgi:hypothetical protein
MKTLLAGILLLPVLTLAQSEPVTVDKKVICEQTKIALPALKQASPEEKAVWMGRDRTSYYAMLADEKAGTWTLIQFNDEMTCIIGMGIDHRLAPSQSK